MQLTCPQCQTVSDLPPGANHCPRCGALVASGPVLAAEPLPPIQARVSRLAVASFVFAFVICLPILNAGIAVGLGIGALVNIGNSKGALKGRGLAIAGIVLGGLSVFGALPALVIGSQAISRYVLRSRTDEVRGQVRSLAQAEFDYYQAHGRFVRVAPVPLVRPTFASPTQSNEGTLELGWKPPEFSRYQFEVRVDGNGPESRALVTADSGLTGPGSPPPHEEALVTSATVGEVTEVPQDLR